jgi:NAD(P)H-dependent flavin oxidoreductase YrpB (nitropropane dioxygenase family)
VAQLFEQYQVPAATHGNFFSQYVRSQSLFEEQLEAVLASDIDIFAAQGRPVLAAGGIGCGAQIAAALAMGAQGAWLGTAWLGTQEHELPAALTRKLIAANSDDTTITRAHSGKPCRVVRSAFSDAWDAPNAPPPLGMPFQQALTGELLAAAEQYEIEPLMYEAAGQSIAWLKEIQPVSAVMQRLVQETQTALQALRPYLQRLN